MFSFTECCFRFSHILAGNADQINIHGILLIENLIIKVNSKYYYGGIPACAFYKQQTGI